MYIKESLNCDASFLWGKKIMEWQVKDTLTGEILYHNKVNGGTSNIAEFLAIVDAMIYQEQNGLLLPIYSDSRIAINWVRIKTCRTWETDLPKDVEQVIEEYEQWLEDYGFNYEVLKWHTRSWGEIPSDFGRK
jgi:ribonuclease HI